MLEELLEKGYQLTPDAFKVLKESENSAKIISIILNKVSVKPDLPPILNADVLTSLLASEKESKTEVHLTVNNVASTGSAKIKPVARDLNDEIKVLFDPTGKSYSTGKTEEFVKYFQNRYMKIKKIFLSRKDMSDVIDISEVGKASTTEGKIKIIAMVMDKKTTGKGNLLLELEDPSGTIKAVVNKTNKELFLKANNILLDQVLCFEGSPSASNLFFVEEIHWPNTSTQHKIKSCEERVYAALLSDLHIGSKQFLEKYFTKFISWLKGEIGSEKQRELSGRVKYIIIAGDLVDGIGVYPKQEDELSILDVVEQYERAASYLEQIPEHIKIIISPGNHDPSRQALPQPAIPEKYARELYNMGNVIMVGNPALIQIQSHNFLIYHGRSLDDLATSIQGASALDPVNLMKELLICRHLAPEFGNKTPISPEVEDYLVIESEPDVFHTGHLHINGVGFYRNIALINSGTWQSQTAYQRNMGVTPTPCKVPLYDLKENKVHVIDFMEYNGG
ncbi:MAG: DNA-directed DNA polymerase II small subunit [Candidatus Odinarchaeum yellowstonii]|uniref:DNA polymerase II small subunit n=1 Tax=Odinarchaeota yellowstonii (strain LCB_4) TaxID=1841599 RepID=A0AAF0IC22_ODILC|nr:MAG: DNA-directed DNA polymerase II small subunit [Candidatus Odinarchaeum yellowstonii]